MFRSNAHQPDGAPPLSKSPATLLAGILFAALVVFLSCTASSSKGWSRPFFGGGRIGDGDLLLDTVGSSFGAETTPVGAPYDLLPPPDSVVTAPFGLRGGRLPPPEFCANWTDNLQVLAAVLRADPEKTALRPLTISGAGDGDVDVDGRRRIIEVPGLNDELLSDAFRGRRTVMVGDSTTRNLSKWLRFLLEFADPDLVNGLGAESTTLGDAKDRVMARSRALVGSFEGDRTHAVPTTEQADGTYLRYMPLLGGCVEDDWGDVLLRTRPDVIVANRGLHLLHLTNEGRNAEGCVIRKWLDYEAWLDEVIAAAEASTARLLLLKTTNFVCRKKFFGKWARGSRLYATGRKKTLATCVEIVRREVGPELGLADAERYCRYGAFNDAGARHLNDRLYEHVRRRKEEEGGLNVTLAVFNDHDVESCSYTNDGRHYNALNLLRVRLLGNSLQCLMVESSAR